MTLKRNWDAINAELPLSKAVIPSGRHEVERIDNPLGYKDAPWLVLKGTMIGATEASWRQWQNDPNSIVTNRDNPDYGKPIKWYDYEVIIEG